MLLHVHGRFHSNTIWFGGLSLMVSAFVSVKNLVNLPACNDWVIRCIAFVVFGYLESSNVLVCASGEKAGVCISLW